MKNILKMNDGVILRFPTPATVVKEPSATKIFLKLGQGA